MMPLPFLFYFIFYYCSDGVFYIFWCFKCLLGATWFQNFPYSGARIVLYNITVCYQPVTSASRGRVVGRPPRPTCYHPVTNASGERAILLTPPPPPTFCDAHGTPIFQSLDWITCPICVIMGPDASRQYPSHM